MTARTYGADDLFVVARDRDIPAYVTKVSDQRPVLVRLCLADKLPEPEQMPESLRDALAEPPAPGPAARKPPAKKPPVRRAAKNSKPPM